MTGEIEELKRLLGRDKVYDDPSVVALYSREASGLEGNGFLVVFPESTSDVSAIARWAYKRRIPIYPQGSATSLSGSAVPGKGVIVSFERMNRIYEISVVDSIADVEPGVRIADLNEALMTKGYMFPVDPASHVVATIGGAINTGAGGMKGARYGTMRDWVNQLEIVVPDEKGTVMRVGCRTVKCRQGLDLVRLIVGSEGTLALVTRAVLRITPLPESSPTVMGFFDNVEDLLAAFTELKTRRYPLLLAEFLDETVVSIAKKGVAGFESVRGHMFLASVESNHEAAERIMDDMVAVLKNHGASIIYTAQSLGEAEEKGLLTIRRRLFPAQIENARRFWGKSNVRVFIEDIVVPPSKLVNAINELKSITEKYGLPYTLGGHIGDGNLHPAVGIVLDDKKVVEKAHEWYVEVMKLAIRLGGSISAEHGIGLLKKDGPRLEMEKLDSIKALDIMKAIKRAFDPLNILNPGKLV